MAASNDASSLQKAQELSIHATDRLEITLQMLDESAAKPDFPDMSGIFAAISPSANLAREGVQQSEGSSRLTSLPLRPRIDASPHGLQCRYKSCHKVFDTEQNQHLHEQLHHFLDFSADSNAADLLGKVVTEPLKPFIVHSSEGSREIGAETVVAHMRQSGESEDTIRSVCSSPMMFDYQCQLMLLEQQNRKRLAMARSEPPPGYQSGAGTSVIPQYAKQLEAFQTQKKLETLRSTQYPDVFGRPATVANVDVPGYATHEKRTAGVLAATLRDPPRYVFAAPGAHAYDFFPSQAEAARNNHPTSLDPVANRHEFKQESSSAKKTDHQAELKSLETMNENFLVRKQIHNSRRASFAPQSGAKASTRIDAPKAIMKDGLSTVLARDHLDNGETQPSLSKQVKLSRNAGITLENLPKGPWSTSKFPLQDYALNLILLEQANVRKRKPRDLAANSNGKEPANTPQNYPQTYASTYTQPAGTQTTSPVNQTGYQAYHFQQVEWMKPLAIGPENSLSENDDALRSDTGKFICMRGNSRTQAKPPSHTPGPAPRASKAETCCLRCSDDRQKCDRRQPICQNCEHDRRPCYGWSNVPANTINNDTRPSYNHYAQGASTRPSYFARTQRQSQVPVPIATYEQLAAQAQQHQLHSGYRNISPLPVHSPLPSTATFEQLTAQPRQLQNTAPYFCQAPAHPRAGLTSAQTSRSDPAEVNVRDHRTAPSPATCSTTRRHNRGPYEEVPARRAAKADAAPLVSPASASKQATVEDEGQNEVDAVMNEAPEWSGVEQERARKRSRHCSEESEEF